MLKIDQKIFVEYLIKKITRRYSHFKDIIINIISLLFSLVILIIVPTTFKYIIFSFLTYCLTRMLLMYMFKGLSISSIQYMIHYKNLFMHFIVITHFSLLFLASIIDTFKLEFTRESKIVLLDFFDAYYYVLSIVSTVGSNIYPISKGATLFTMILSFTTLLLIVFLFNNLTNKVTIRYEYFKSAENTLSYYYKCFFDLFLEQKISLDEQNKLFEYLIKDFDFNTPNGFSKVYSEMARGLYPIDGIKLRTKRYNVIINEKKYLVRIS